MASEDDADYRVKLTEAYLKIRKVKVSPSISIAQELALKKGPAIYPVRRVECKTFTIAAGNPSWRKDNGPVFREFMNKHCNEWEWNDRKLQSDWSDVCGHYCIFYLGHRDHGYSMNKIAQLFGNDTVLSDSKVLWFVKAYYRVTLKQPVAGFVQCCKKLIE